MALNRSAYLGGAAEEELSPNQAAKRQAIVAAAVDVLIQDGVHGCTVRAIASSAGVSKGSVHYYFGDVDDIIDLAMLQATMAWIAWIRSVSSLPDADPSTGADLDPVKVFWRAMLVCLEPFAHDDRSIMPLWLEYWAIRRRAQRVEPLQLLHVLLTSYVEELLVAAGASDAPNRASAITSYLFGASMQQSVIGKTPLAIERDLAALSGLEPPVGLRSQA